MPTKIEPMERVVQFGARRIPYRLHVSDRKRLRIVVKPTLEVRVFAPRRARPGEIERAVDRHAPWIARQLDRMATFHPLPTAPRYVSGESLLYLGRQYRLKVLEGPRSPAKLKGGFLEVSVPDPGNGTEVRRLVEAWLRERARVRFEQAVEDCLEVASRHGVTRPEISIRAMRTRWGSCSASGRITLNLHLIRVPTHCIDYVVMHELCHLVHHNHSKAYYRLLTRCMPDWRQRREVLRKSERWWA